MDLNYLFFRQQVERSMAASAASDEARKAHETLAGEYEHQIGTAFDDGTADLDANVNPALACAITAREVETD